MVGVLELLIAERVLLPELLVEAVEAGGGELRELRIRRWSPGLGEAFVRVAYPEPQLPSILSSLGRLSGVAVRGFRPEPG